MVCFGLFTLISLPSLIIYASGNDGSYKDYSDRKLEYTLSVFTLGNLGESNNL